jgi:hypothetical protein
MNPIGAPQKGLLVQTCNCPLRCLTTLRHRHKKLRRINVFGTLPRDNANPLPTLRVRGVARNRILAPA